MQKIITLFQRNYETDRLVRNEVVPGAEWVIAGEGRATRKYDGTCCLVRGGKLFKRYEVPKGGKAPVDFEAATEVDPETGKRQGWVPVGDGPEDRWHREAFANWPCPGGMPVCEVLHRPPDGTYELCGPKIQGNPEGFAVHTLVPHGQYVIGGCPRDFDGLREFLRHSTFEGVVFHHPDGRMVKIKKKDFFKPQRAGKPQAAGKAVAP